MAFSTSSGGRGGSSYRTQTALSDINITPLVDVVLVLLLIFMLTAPVLQSGIEVALPKTRSTEALTEQRTVVTIDKDSNVYLQTTGADQRIAIADLPKLLGTGAGTGTSTVTPSKQVVYVRADERVPFGAFANVMESIKHAGISNISVVTQPFDNK